ncbi:hypothetical protein [Nitrosopumilus ureiphilus]|uniref:Thr operon leader peptide n=1 Tax=Nitrosopumilus ureiphilus TaxID=1470067 RepID=A0A7D5R165_9ARCH|nr:hypothetical protein [Nitrosopumilus ureiphilus]QLH06336.1 hypothetical protein C5F50_04035 [Nitrosopumilus ureiphilus]
MEKQKIISFIAIIIIIGTVGYSLLNVYALEQLEWGGRDNLFRFFSFYTVDDTINICNNSLIPASFNELDILIYFEKKLLGTYVIDSASIMPNSIFEVNGEYSSESLEYSQTLFMHFDHLFSGSDNTVRIDPRKMDVITQYQTTIIGIPYSVSEQYTAFDFWNMLNDEENLMC